MARHIRWNVLTNGGNAVTNARGRRDTSRDYNRRRQHLPDTYDSVLSLVRNPQRLQVPTRQTDADLARSTLRGLGHVNPPAPAKPQVND
jgi:hypothetical protein